MLYIDCFFKLFIMIIIILIIRWTFLLQSRGSKIVVAFPGMGVGATCRPQGWRRRWYLTHTQSNPRISLTYPTMQDFPDDTSPWGQQSSEDDIVPSFSIPDDAGAPWGGASDNDDMDSNYNGMNDSYNPYGSTYGESQNAFVEDTYNKPDSPTEVASSPAAHSPPKNEATEEAPAPQLKSASQRGKANKKKRAGAVKVESVGSDPLAVQASHLDNVELSSNQSSANTSSKAAPDSANSHLSDQNPAISGASPLNPDSINPWDPSGTLNDAPVSSWSDPLEQQSTRSAPNQQREEPNDFEISVSDPATVGELSNTHTEYTVLMTTTYEPYEIKESAVQRRYRDFRWLYRTLEHNHPGIVVPPPPGKQALGRFNDDFVQFRRAALEQMLVKVTKHPALKGDKDLEAFLTSNDFGEYLESRMKSDSDLKNATISAYQADGEGSANGGEDSSNGGGGGGAFGFIGSLTGALMLTRGNEADPWTVEKRLRLGELEASLREVIKDFIAVSLHRQQLSESLKEYADVIRALSDIEATRRLSTVLRSFAKVQERLAQIAERQRKQNVMNLEATLSEHLRVIGSVKDAISARQKVFSEAEEAATELEKKQQALDKVTKYNNTQQDRQMGLEQDIAELGKKASELHQKAGSIAHLVESEINRVTDEKIAEFRNSVELYLESTIEAHKETIEVWETFYTRHFTKS